MGWASAIRRAPAPQEFNRPTFPPAKVDWAKLVTIVVPTNKVQAALDKIDWSTHSALCHHAQFDGLILSHHYNVVPKFYYCTLSMARGWLANDIGAGLDEVAQHFGRGQKTEGVLEKTKGVLNWSKELYAEAAVYCANDTDLTHTIFKDDLLQNFPQTELDLIDATCQMFCCPVLLLDEPRARVAMETEIDERDTLIRSVIPEGITFEQMPSAHRRELLKKVPEPNNQDVLLFAGRKIVGSSEQFADLLRGEGVEPPTKVSKAWMALPPAERTDEGKYSYAFAKDDMGMMELGEDESPRVRALVECRLAVKSNTNITRAGRLLNSGANGRPMPVYYKYAGAHTWRFSGGDGQNWQNFKRGGELRLSIQAPKNNVLVVVDSGQIEVRVNAWLWGQTDLLDQFRQSDVYEASQRALPKDQRKMATGDQRDPYCRFGDTIYGYEVTRAHEKERFIAKTAVLGLGFQMGGPKFKGTLARGVGGPAVFIEINEAYSIVNTYRRQMHRIKDGWAKCESIIEDMAHGRTGSYKCISWEKETIWLPNGMRLKYPNLRKNKEDDWVYDRKGNAIKMYGGILCENIVQALARIIVAADQLLTISRKYPVVMTTHDEVVAVVPAAQGPSAFKFMHKTFCTPPAWCADIPLSAEGGFASNYSK